jgi:kynureninase
VLRSHYARFLARHPERLHFTAHSHHPWPDVTRAAVLACWDDAALLADEKWARIFGEVVPRAQAHVARILGLRDPRNITFAPNTHELVSRLLSAFDLTRGLRILTTDGEFMSFTRQAARLQELPTVQIERVPTSPLGTFAQRFRERLQVGGHDVVFVSQVFFDSGFAVPDLPALVRAVPDPRTVLIIDGYHGFWARPTALAEVEGRAFYVAGGYKYAQSGEGAAFMHVPAGCTLRPVNTGWLADFGGLTSASPGTVAFPDDAFRFWGSTFDPTGLYRFNAAMDWLQDLGVAVDTVHAHVLSLQRRFLAALEAAPVKVLSASALVTPRDLEQQGNFLAFRLPDAAEVAQALEERGVSTDVRGDRLRIGFGMYHEEGDVDLLVERLRSIP